MTATVLSSKGRAIIPKPLLDALHWKSGQRLEVINMDGGILLKPVQSFSPTTLVQVAARLQSPGSAKPLADIEEAIRQGMKATHHDRG